MPAAVPAVQLPTPSATTIYLQQLVYVEADVTVQQGWVQHFEICVVDKLKYQAGGL